MLLQWYIRVVTAISR